LKIIACVSVRHDTDTSSIRNVSAIGHFIKQHEIKKKKNGLREREELTVFIRNLNMKKEKMKSRNIVTNDFGNGPIESTFATD